jgi:hypothetical protein
MRLINCKSLELEEFFGNHIPDYAILSHTWGGEEVTFSDLPLHQAPAIAKSGYRKIKHTCEQALRHGLYYAWIDTCCIDKTSSAELSEAINSMYVWYRDSTRCYAMLDDVSTNNVGTELGASRWFTRGWTLQELIAPPEVIFYDRNWIQLGTRQDLAASISKTTLIDEMVLYHGIASFGSRHKPPMQAPRLDQFCIAKKMSWASLRKTTREEDIAYCLLGIFELNMPLLYGEGGRAFVRLQEELMHRTDDDSILAWSLSTEFQSCPNVQTTSYSSARFTNLLAASPKSFRYSMNLERTVGSTIPFSKSNIGLHIHLPTLPIKMRSTRGIVAGLIGLLRCVRSTPDESKQGNMLGILLFPLDPPHARVANRRLARRAYRHQGKDWGTVPVDVGDLIRSKVEAVILMSNGPTLLHDGRAKEQALRGKNECFIVSPSPTLGSMLYHFTHAKSWLSYDCLRSTPSEDIGLKSGSYTFVNHNFSTNVLFMTFENWSEPHHKAFTVAIDLYSGLTGVWDVSLRYVANDNLVSYCWLARQGPEICCYTKGKLVTYYHSNPFSITVKLLETKVIHEWRIHKIDIEVDTEIEVDVPQCSPEADLTEPFSSFQID